VRPLAVPATRLAVADLLPEPVRLFQERERQRILPGLAVVGLDGADDGEDDGGGRDADQQQA
jgi:hypothetical protein